VTPQLVERLRHAYPKAIAGMKDRSGDRNNLETFLDAFAETARPARIGFDVFVGSESFLLANIRNGGVGTISATANVNPAAIHELYACAVAPAVSALLDREGQQLKLNVVRDVFTNSRIRSMFSELKQA